MKTLFVLILIFISGASRAQVWMQVFAPDGEDIEGILADHGGRVFIGTDTGAFSTTDNGATWQNDTVGLDAPDEFSFVELRDGTLLTGTELGGVFRSTDYGLHWQASNTGLPDSGFVAAMVSRSDQAIFASLVTHGLYFSSDEGRTWVLRDTGLPKASIFSLALSPTGDIYAGLTGFIARSTNEGLDWTICDTLRPSDEALAMGVDSAGDVFAGMFHGLVLRSSDRGVSWDTISPQQTLPVRCIALTGESLFVGTYGSGVWKSTDLGDQWSRMSDGLSGKNLNVLCSSVAPDSNLFIGTLASVVFRANVSSSSSVPIPIVSNDAITFSCEQSFSGAKFHFTLPTEQRVELSVYDITGRKIDEVYNGSQSAGDHSFSFNNHQLPNEVCFAVLTTESGRLVQPFTLVQ